MKKKKFSFNIQVVTPKNIYAHTEIYKWSHQKNLYFYNKYSRIEMMF